MVAASLDLKMAPDFSDLQKTLRSCALIMINVRMHTRENYFYEQLSASAMFTRLFLSAVLRRTSTFSMHNLAIVLLDPSLP